MCIWPQRGVTTTEHSVTHWFAAVTIAVTAQVAALWCRRCCNCGVRMLSSSCLSVRCLGCGGGWLTGLLLLSLGVLPRCRSWFSATWCRKSYRLRQRTCWSSGCGVCVCFIKKDFGSLGKLSLNWTQLVSSCFFYEIHFQNTVLVTVTNAASQHAKVEPPFKCDLWVISTKTVSSIYQRSCMLCVAVADVWIHEP